jgi:hypothetical protein
MVSPTRHMCTDGPPVVQVGKPEQNLIIYMLCASCVPDFVSSPKCRGAVRCQRDFGSSSSKKIRKASFFSRIIIASVLIA